MKPDNWHETLATSDDAVTLGASAAFFSFNRGGINGPSRYLIDSGRVSRVAE